MKVKWGHRRNAITVRNKCIWKHNLLIVNLLKESYPYIRILFFFIYRKCDILLHFWWSYTHLLCVEGNSAQQSGEWNDEWICMKMTWFLNEPHVERLSFAKLCEVKERVSKLVFISLKNRRLIPTATYAMLHIKNVGFRTINPIFCLTFFFSNTYTSERPT